MPLRNFQEECERAILTKRAAGVKRQLISMATGLGKGTQFANLARTLKPGKRMMLLVHTIDLVEQGAERIRQWTPGLKVGIERAKEFAGDEPVVAASVQTLGLQGSTRLDAFNPNEFEWLVVDECHHVTNDSYKRVIDHFLPSHVENPPCTLVGFTATPNRADNEPLGSVFDEIVYQYSIQDGIKNGWLVDIKGIKVKTTTDISKVGTKDGELKQKELEEAVNTPERNRLIVDAWVDNCYPRKTVVFCVDVQHAKDLARAFQTKGVPAEAVWGTDPDRKSKMEQYESGRIMVMMNVKVLIEGFDLWSISCAVLAAPSKSQGKLVQEVGRTTRLQFGMWNLNEARANGTLKPTDKVDALVMDVSDTAGKHSLATFPSLFGLGPRLDLKGTSVMAAVKAIEAAQLANPNADFSNLEDVTKLKSFIEHINLFTVNFCQEIVEVSELQWHRLTDNRYRLLMPGKEMITISGDLLGEYSVKGTVLGERVEMEHFSSLADAITFAESNITSKNKSMLTLLRRESKWHKEPVSEGQLKLLKQFKVPPTVIAGMSKGDAAKWITTKLGNRK